MQDDIAALFAYDRWANRKVFDACRKLTAEQYVAEPSPAGRRCARPSPTSPWRPFNLRPGRRPG